jgi:hypothetical protein
MRIQTAELHPNPFRRLDRYPVNDEKIAALKRSITDTTFWDNLLVRRSPNGKGGFEIAYGHNRLEALKQLKIGEIDVPVRDLDDTTMARIMSHENLEEWGHSSSIEQETVRAIVEAYAEGRIEFPPLKRSSGDGDGGSVRFAPAFKVGSPPQGGEHPYSIATLATFLGWKEYKVDAALNALALIDDNLASETTFQGLTTKQAQTVTQQAKRALKETGDKQVAKSVAKHLSTGMRKATGKKAADGTDRQLQDVTIHNAKRVTDDLIGTKYKKTKPPKSKKLPPIGRFAEGLAITLGKIVPTHEAKIKQIIEFRGEPSFSRASRNMLVKSMFRLANDMMRFVKKLEDE